MASFTDNPSILGNFNPYIQTLPVEAMTQVGMVRQEEFDKGVSIVQGYVDTVAGLPIAKGEIKNYVQTKLGQLKEGVTKNLSGDFSDHRVVNQIGGAAKMIASDPIVQGGVTSAARIQSSMAELAEAKKAGKSGPRNEAALQQSISEYLNDGKLDSQFTGSYTPYVDIIDRFVKFYKDQNAGEDISQDAFRYDSNAVTKDNPEGRVINPVLFKGKGPDKIQALFNVILSQGDVQAQLKIDGWYKFRGVTQNQLGQSLTTTTAAALENNKKAISSLETKIRLGATDSPVLSAQLEQLKSQDIAARKRYDRIIEKVKTDPEGAKVELAKEELLSDLTNAFSYQIAEKSPMWEANMQERVFQREWYEWQQTYAQKEKENEWNRYKDNETLKIAKAKAEKEKKDSGGADVITSGQIESKNIPVGSAKAYADLDASADEYGEAVFELVSLMKGGGENSPVIKNSVTGRFQYNYGNDGKHKYKTKEEAVDAASEEFKKAKDSYMNGTMENAYANTLMEKVNKKGNNYRSNTQIVVDVEEGFKPMLLEIRRQVGNEDYANAYIVKKHLPGWQGIEQTLKKKYDKTYTKEGYEFHQTWEQGMGIDKSNEGDYRVQGEHYDEYNRATHTLEKDLSLTAALEKREIDFNERQTLSAPLLVTHDVVETKARESVNTTFNALARSRAVDPSTGKGDAAKILDLTGKKPSERGGLQYRSDINTSKGTAHIEITDGTKVYSMEVSRDDFCRQFPERCVQSDFREEFGAILNQTKGQSTDPLGDGMGGGRANALPAPQSDPKFPFVVRYHLVAQADKKYAMRLWVTPKPTVENDNPTPIINGEYASGMFMGMPDVLTEEEVMEWKNKLKDSNWLTQQLQLRFKPKTQ